MTLDQARKTITKAREKGLNFSVLWAIDTEKEYDLLIVKTKENRLRIEISRYLTMSKRTIRIAQFLQPFL